eukprot:TRINITY_DN4291_c0_g1_i1.p3 TRINITY_DN4291_c0_g1~~TRINITY_DN4291_c0_g1_i1.p3  ORF type:complete len:128 (+),score=44.05 TRINITY_DN4291_c0_g1_i1:87-470(+)
MDNTKLVIVLLIIVLLFALVVAVVLYWYKQQSPHQEMPIDGDYGLGNGENNGNFSNSPRQPDKPLLNNDANRSMDDESSAARGGGGGRGVDLSRSVGRGPSGLAGTNYAPPRGGKGPGSPANPLTAN